MIQPPITSLANLRVKAAVRLRDRRERETTGLTIVDGAREILRALDAGVQVATIFIAEDLLRTPEAHLVAEQVGHRPTTIAVSPAVLARIAYGERSDGLVAIVRTPQMTLADLVVPDDALVVVLEGVEKPGNLGAVLRTADGAGAYAVIAADPRTDPYNPNVIRASLGTIFALPFVAATTEETLIWLREHGIRPLAAIVDAATDYAAADLRGPLAIVLGSEAGGLTTAWRDPGVTPISIPMHGIADSLNVSIAAAIVLYEAIRQRSLPNDRGH
jgi:TrmH family RNA methyltransferase